MKNFYSGYVASTVCHYKQMMYFDYGCYDYIETDFGARRDTDLLDIYILRIDDMLFYQRPASIQVARTCHD